MVLAQHVIARARAAFRVGSALERAAESRLWQSVREEQSVAEGRVFAVPSQSRPGLEHIVVKRRRRTADEPTWALYSCSCEASRREACVHRAAVFQFLYRRRFGAVPVRVASTTHAAAA
jgi:hypothetical protein